MCVILHGLKKKHVRRAEVQEAMRCNSAGFFLAALYADGERSTVRTMDSGEALSFFDKIDDEVQFVMHARIPSRGDKGLANVHGWEEDRILFSHNMTITAIDDMMRRADWKNTDSEFFFRKLFMPFFRGYGKDAYRDGKFHPDIENFVEHFVGTCNKFCFVMPDNRVLRFGSWVREGDRKENGECAFYASNTSYRTYQSAWSGYGTKGGSPQSGGGFCHAADPDYDDYWNWEGYRGCGLRSEHDSRSEDRTLVGNSVRGDEDEFHGSVLRELAGDAGVLRLALSDLVARNLIELRKISEEETGEPEAMRIVEDGALPEAFTDDTYEAVKDGLQWAVCADDDAMEMFIDGYAREAERAIHRAGTVGFSPYRTDSNSVRNDLDTIRRGLDRTWKEFLAFSRLMNLSLDFECKRIEDFATAYVMERSRKGNFVMARVESSDLLSVPDMPIEDAVDAVQTILGTIECEEAMAEEEEPQKGNDTAAKAAGTPVRKEGKT